MNGRNDIQGIQSEWLKYKRTFMRKLILLAPLFFVLMAIPQKLLMPAGYLRQWQLLIDLVFNWWPVLFLPLGTALFAALADSQEKKSGGIRSLRSHNVSACSLWIDKVTGMAMHTFLASLVLFCSVLLAGWITAKGAVPWKTILSACLVTWITSLPLLPLQLWAAAWKGVFFSMALGFAGMMTGVLAAQKPFWPAVSWSWPTRLMCPIIGVHPNGTLLEATDPLRDPSVIPVGIGLSLTAFAAVTVLTAFWFRRQEVK